MTDDGMPKVGDRLTVTRRDGIVATGEIHEIEYNWFVNDEYLLVFEDGSIEVVKSCHIQDIISI